MISPADEEARDVLKSLARGRFGRISPALIAEHVLAIVPGDWPVRRGAMDALARRYDSAHRDGLRIAGRPPRFARPGRFRTVDDSKGARPYTTEILSLDPLQTACGCADFVRSSLGLCKHGLAIIDGLAEKPAGRRSRPRDDVPRLLWDPIHPPGAPRDRLLRLTLVSGRGHGFDSDGSPSASMLAPPDRRRAWIGRLLRVHDRGALAADPGAVTLLREEQERSLSEKPATSRVTRAEKALATLRRGLYPYQREGVRRFFERGRLLLADDMGLGKTTQAIAACHAFARAGYVKRGLLIVPASLKGQWHREWTATTDEPLTIVDGSPEERKRVYESSERGFLAIGYEQLIRDLLLVQKWGPDMVVLDEAQRIKNWATKSAAYVKSLTPEYRLVLTGTPMENRLDELASIMDFVDDLALEPKWRLAPYHSDMIGDAGRGVSGARNLGVLRAQLAGSMVRRVRRDVLAQLPKRTDTRVPVEVTTAQRERHDQLTPPIAALAGISKKRPLTQAEFLKLMTLLAQQRMIANGLAQVDFDEVWPEISRSKPTPEVLERMFAPKLSALRALIDQVVVTQGRKAVIFSQWRKMLRLSEWAIRDLLSRAGMRAVFFTGAESAALRERAIIEFHDDPTVTVMFLSDAGGVGLNLQRAASCCVNLEMPWNPAVLEQRIGRIYRLGQTLPIDVYNLVAEDSIEAKIAELVARKKAVFTSLFDGTTDEVKFDGSSSFLETVRKIVEPVEVPSATEDEQPPPAEAPAPRTEVEAAPQPSGKLSVTRMPDGGLRVEAPPELAGPLADLLESLARSLRGGSVLCLGRESGNERRREAHEGSVARPARG